MLAYLLSQVPSPPIVIRADPPPSASVSTLEFLLGTLIVVLMQLVALWRQSMIKKDVNGRMDQLIQVTARAAKVEGVMAGQELASGVNLGGVHVPTAVPSPVPKRNPGDFGPPRPPDKAP